MSTDGQRIKWRRNIAENFNPSSRGHERYRGQTDGRTTTYSERDLAKKKEIKNIRYSSNVVKMVFFTGKNGYNRPVDFVPVPDPTRKTSTRTRPVPTGRVRVYPRVRVDPHTSRHSQDQP